MHSRFNPNPERATLRRERRPRLWIWLCWLAGFYAVWSWLVFGHGQWAATVSHWPIAVAMLFGSYIAGSTPMDGGTIGFPILVLLFDQPAQLGRDFSFAVQSIGMTSASIFILARRQPIAWSIFWGALAGAVLALPVGILVIAPHIPALWVKVVFAVIWAGFGVLHLYRLHEIAAGDGVGPATRPGVRAGFVVGLLTGLTVVAITGVGIDMVLYAVLILMCRTDLKIAIPTSVLIMASCSLFGVLLKALTVGFQPGVYAHWLAAAPVVALGAPLGVLVVHMLGRTPTLLVVSVLCVAQFAWTCHAEFGQLGWTGVGLSLLAVAGFLLVLEQLRARRTPDAARG